MASNDPLRDIVIGYPKLAARMEIQPESAIFRRFGWLNAQNLLYLQAELISLEKQLRERQVADSTHTTGKKAQYALDWFWLSQSEDDGDTEQLDLVLRIRALLDEYSRPFSRPTQTRNVR